MTRVITYGTFDRLHQGHINLLTRAKELGNYLIVGVTADSFDLSRGKINTAQSLSERIESIKNLEIADEIIVEEYEGQKIDDIKKYKIDIFAIGSDWEGKFDYLNDYCKVIYLKRTEGISSSEIRTKDNLLKLGIIGNIKFLEKFEKESNYVNGIVVEGICTNSIHDLPKNLSGLNIVTDNYEELLSKVDAIYIVSTPQNHYSQIYQALIKGKHVLCEAPTALSIHQYDFLVKLARDNKCILMDALRTAFSIAYNRMILLVKSGIIGKVYSIDATCTSLINDFQGLEDKWNSVCSWGPTAMLPIFSILGTNYKSLQINSHIINDELMFDSFTNINFTFNNSVASIKVAKGVKSEGSLIISGTEGYVFVPAPWWKTDYFEIRREDSSNNKRYYYNLEGEGLRYELLYFLKAIKTNNNYYSIPENITKSIISVIEKFYKKELIQI